MTYDGLGRRIGKTITNSGDMNATYKFFYDASTGLGTGGRHVRVRGAAKVAAHLSFGLLVIAAEQLLTMLC